MDTICLGFYQNQVYSLLKQGKSKKEISETLDISKSTINSHLVRIYAKGGFENINDMLAFKGKIVVNKEPVAGKSKSCAFIKEQILNGVDDDEIINKMAVKKCTYKMLKRLVMNEIYTKCYA